jgi:hypothetical protein
MAEQGKTNQLGAFPLLFQNTPKYLHSKFQNYFFPATKTIEG